MRREKRFPTLIYILVRKGGMSNVMVVVNHGSKNVDGLKRSQARFRVRRTEKRMIRAWCNIGNVRMLRDVEYVNFW